MANRVLISDIDAPHAAQVKEAIIDGYGSDISADIVTDTSLDYSQAVTYAIANGFELIVRSVDGANEAGMNRARAAYFEDILTFFPLGSNTAEEVAYPTELLYMVMSGAGDTQNRTAYGDGIEFWDVETIDAGFQSSFSNGVVAGKFLKIKDGRAGSWWDTRYAARETAGNSGVWDSTNGYGKIDVTAAIAFAGAVPADSLAHSVTTYAADDYTARYAGVYTCADNYCT